MSYLYHITNRANLDSILKNGLIPQIGKNSLKNNEKRPYVFLCIKEHIPYWQILLEIDDAVILSIDTSGLNIDNSAWICYKFLYEELCFENNIPPESIRVVDYTINFTKNYIDECMTNLCKGFLNDLVVGIDYFLSSLDIEGESAIVPGLTGVLDDSLNTLSKLDFSVIEDDIDCTEILDKLNDLKKSIENINIYQKIEQLIDAINNINSKTIDELSLE